MYIALAQVHVQCINYSIGDIVNQPLYACTYMIVIGHSVNFQAFSIHPCSITSVTFDLPERIAFLGVKVHGNDSGRREKAWISGLIRHTPVHVHVHVHVSCTCTIMYIDLQSCTCTCMYSAQNVSMKPYTFFYRKAKHVRLSHPPSILNS